MHVTLRLTDPDERDALRAFLEKRECQVEELADDLLRVGLPHARGVCRVFPREQRS
jgi:hypothetical protein